MAIKDAIAALDSIGKQGATIWAADRASQTAAATLQAQKEQWLAEQQAGLYKSMFESSDKLLSDLSKEVFAGNFDIDDVDGANYKIYKQQWNRRGDAFKQWAHALGQPTFDSETDIIALVDDVFEKTIETTDNPRKYLKFGDTKGKWAEAVSRFSPGVDLDLVEIVWNNRYDQLEEGGPEAGGWIPGATGKMDYKTDVYTPDEGVKSSESFFTNLLVVTVFAWSTGPLLYHCFIVSVGRGVYLSCPLHISHSPAIHANS